jgi:hypothetical protein
VTGPDAVLREHLAQPDQRSCGATALVVARMLLDRDYADLLVLGRHPATGFAVPGSLASRFRDEVLTMHRRVTGPVDATGRLQLPWPRALGTPPWAVARQLSATAGSGLPRASHTVVAARADRGALFDRIVAALAQGRPVPVYVGSRWLPRHVVLFLGGTPAGAAWAGTERDVRCYDPARGRVVDVDREAFVGGRLGLGRWRQVWFAVLPSLPPPPSPPSL